MSSSKLLKELKEERRKNFIGNMWFIDYHVNRLKGKTNKEWSSEQARFIDGLYIPMMEQKRMDAERLAKK
ncbi:MAG: hypothetical protein ACREBW_05155 [Candidatus Micrarchaeaceae archaeon]